MYGREIERLPEKAQSREPARKQPNTAEDPPAEGKDSCGLHVHFTLSSCVFAFASHCFAVVIPLVFFHLLGGYLSRGGVFDTSTSPESAKISTKTTANIGAGVNNGKMQEVGGNEARRFFQLVRLGSNCKPKKLFAFPIMFFVGFVSKVECLN